jgi:hypothetical protein
MLNSHVQAVRADIEPSRHLLYRFNLEFFGESFLVVHEYLVSSLKRGSQVSIKPGEIQTNQTFDSRWQFIANVGRQKFVSQLVR